LLKWLEADNSIRGHRKRSHESTTSLYIFSLQHTLFHSLYSSSHTVDMNVGSDSHMITSVSNKCFGLINIGGRGLEKDSRQREGSFL
jgi:hypothetical protein